MADDFPGGLPGQEQLLTSRAVFKNSYAVIPKGVLTDIVASLLPHWKGTRAWVQARPLSGFAETFSQYLMEVEPGGGSAKPDPDKLAQTALFILKGTVAVRLDGNETLLRPGGFAFIPAGASWQLYNHSYQKALFIWIRKKFEQLEGLSPPDPIFGSAQNTQSSAMPGTDGSWSTQRLIDPDDIRYDMHINIVSFAPGGVIPFPETHVMEHGITILEGKAVYRLNEDWVEVEKGDFLWLRAFCPQACYAGGPGPFRYLLYKDVNRHALLWR